MIREWNQQSIEREVSEFKERLAKNDRMTNEELWAWENAYRNMLEAQARDGALHSPSDVP